MRAKLASRLSALPLHPTTDALACCDCRLFSGTTPNFQQSSVTSRVVGERNRDDPLATFHSQPDCVFDTSVDHGPSSLSAAPSGAFGFAGGLVFGHLLGAALFFLEVSFSSFLGLQSLRHGHL